MKSFNEYQEAAMKTAIYEDTIYPVLGLAEEAGEVAGKFGKAIRDKTDLPTEVLVKELGDVLWMLAAICRDNDLSLEYVANKNIEKLASRAQRGVLGGSGDDR